MNKSRVTLEAKISNLYYFAIMELLYAMNAPVSMYLFSVCGLVLVTISQGGRHHRTHDLMANTETHTITDLMPSESPIKHLTINAGTTGNKDKHQETTDIFIANVLTEQEQESSVNTKHHANKIRHRESKLRSNSGRRRNVRHTKHQHVYSYPQKSCKTKSSFVYLKEAVDMFGDSVTVYPFINIGTVAVDQYFYETFCDKEACQCTGIDETKYRSSCETNYSFTYARVIKNGELGWTQIMIRSGCSCVIHEMKHKNWARNIIDSL